MSAASYQRVATNFSKAAATYDQHALYQQRHTRNVFEAACRLLPAQARILDVGCGTGYFAALAAQAGKAWDVVGLDIAHGMCMEASGRCATVRGDMSSLPISEQSFDAVVSSLSLQWAADLPAVMQEISRIIKNNGIIIIQSIANKTLCELWKAIRAADSGISLKPLPMESAYKDAAIAAKLYVETYEVSYAKEHYTTVKELLHSMRRIGAGVRGEDAHKRPLRWKSVLRHYDAVDATGGISATWEEVFMVVRKQV